MYIVEWCVLPNAGGMRWWISLKKTLLCNKCIDMASNCCLTMQIHLLSNLKNWAEKLELALWGWG